MLDKRTLARINNRPRGRGLAAYAALGVAVAASLSALFSYVLAATIFLAGTAIASLLHKREVAARTIELTYDLDAEAASGFAAVREACEALSDAEKVWRVEGAAGDRGSSDLGDEPLSFGVPSRHPVEVGLLRRPASRRTYRFCRLMPHLSTVRVSR